MGGVYGEGAGGGRQCGSRCWRLPRGTTSVLASTGWCTVLKSLTIRSFRSLANVELRLNHHAAVGPNGSGKSNVIDALRFVTDALATSLAVAVSQRGGLPPYAGYRVDTRDTSFRLLMTIPDEDSPLTSEYSFEIGTEPGEGGFSVRQGAASFIAKTAQRLGETRTRARLEERSPTSPAPARPVGVASGRQCCARTRVLSRPRGIDKNALLQPRADRIETAGPYEGNILLIPDGSNAVSVVRELHRHHSEDYALLCELLGKIVPGVASVNARSVDRIRRLYSSINSLTIRRTRRRFDPGTCPTERSEFWPSCSNVPTKRSSLIATEEPSHSSSCGG